MNDVFEPVAKQSLTDRLALRIREQIRTGGRGEGDRLPAIVEMARQFGVGQPTIREALKKLQTMGVVEIRHGSGVYVKSSDDLFVVAAPEYAGTVTKEMLLDLVRTRLALELEAVRAAARHATPEQTAEMRRVLAGTDDDGRRDAEHGANGARFHDLVAAASGNRVLVQLLAALQHLFVSEQQAVFGAEDHDDREHRHILDAIDRRDETLAVTRMRAHFDGLEAAVRQWDPQSQARSSVERVG